MSAEDFERGWDTALNKDRDAEDVGVIQTPTDRDQRLPTKPIPPDSPKQK